MSLRNFLKYLMERKRIVEITKPVSTEFETAALLKKLDSTPVFFHKLREYPEFKLVGNICASREIISKALNVSANKLFSKLVEAIENPVRGEVVENPPCQEVVERKPDLGKIPFLRFGELDGGPYITAGIVIAYDKEYGFNASYHRLMFLDRNHVAVRILPRHLDKYIQRGSREVAITVGNHPAFMLASAVSWKIGVSELDIANKLYPMSFARTLTNNLLVPAESEVILEGEITDEWADEGPFLDITGTYDIVRKQRVIEIKCITMRRNPIFQAILPAGREHRLLMGTPREAVIYREIKAAGIDCIDVKLTPGGCSWLHGVIKIRKKNEEDGRRAIEIAFKAHKSLKHVIVVDEDIDIDDLSDIEWAIATRVQLDRDLVLKPGELGSSLDPSADQVTRRTCKAGVDATIPLREKLEKFKRARIPGEEEIRVEEYLDVSDK